MCFHASHLHGAEGGCTAEEPLALQPVLCDSHRHGWLHQVRWDQTLLRCQDPHASAIPGKPLGSFGKSNMDQELSSGGKSSIEHLETARGMYAAAHDCAALAFAGPVHCRLSGKATQ